MRKNFNLFRIATLLLIIFFLGHTLGLLFHEGSGTVEEGVRSLMKSAHFTIQGADCTYYGFLLGSGLLFSVFLLFSAYLTWLLGKPNAPKALEPITWGLFFSYIAVAILCWTYFFAVPIVISILLVLIFGYKCLGKPKKKRA
jgi:hypothetical protein